MPSKPNHLTVYLASFQDPNLYYAINIDYGATLSKTLDNLRNHRSRPRSLAKIPEQLYNKYGQLVPLEYQVSRTDLVFYIDKLFAEKLKIEDLLYQKADLSSKSDCFLSDSE